MAEKRRLQFLNSFYFKRDYKDKNYQYIEKNGVKERVEDQLDIVYRNLKTGKKGIRSIVNPDFHFYQLTEEEEMSGRKYYKDFIEEDKVHAVKCKYHRLLPTLAELADNREYRNERSMYSGNNKALMKMHQVPIFYGSDINIEDYYKGAFLDKYDSTGKYLTKGYFDIEVDTKGHIGFPREDEALCPVNALTYVNEENMTAYVLLLRNEENPLIKELEDNIQDFKKEIQEEFDELYDHFEYRILFFDNELGLIKEFFRLVKDLQPDFMMAWNIRFDMLTLINRLKQFGVNPEDVICDDDFTRKKCFFYADTKHSNPEDKNDYFDCTSYTTYLDQLLVYAQIRKGLGKKESYRLNDIASEELKDKKIDYTEIGTLSDLPYVDYKMFVKYNIKDVLLCYRLEKKNDDIGLYYNIAELTRTRITKTMKKTISIKNLMYKFARDRGLVMGNNMNISYYNSGDKVDDTPKEKLEGK